MASAVTPEKRILVPLDGSGLAARTVATGADLADRLGARLVLLTVAPHAPSPCPPAVRSRLESYMDHVLVRTRTSLVPDVQIADGDPAERILAAARDKSAYMIVMATHGRPALSRTLLGAVTEAVLQRTGIPVLVMHPEILPMPWAPIPRRQVVIVPLDGSPRAERAVPLACALARAFDARLELVRTVASCPAPALAGSHVTGHVPDEFTRGRRAAQDYLEQAARSTRTEAGQVGIRVVAGLPGEEIATLAAREPAALVVVATSGVSAAHGIAPDSVADVLVRTGPVPTVVVPARSE